MSERVTAAKDEPAGGAAWSEPLAIVLSDRLCMRCGFNLIGQPIVREPRYGLRIVQCPHCGQVAPLEADPALGPWLARWSALAAALWLVLLIVMALGALGFTVGITIAASAESTELYGRDVREAYRQWRERHQAPVPEPAFPRFWEEEGSARRPTLRDVEWEETTLVLVPAGGAIVAGSFWSLALLSWRRRRLAVIGLVIILALGALLGAVWLLLAALPLVSSDQAAWIHMIMPMMLVSGVLVSAAFLISLLFARSVARLLVLALLPPGLRGALGFLWTAEGLDPPEPAPGAARGMEVRGGR